MPDVPDGYVLTADAAVATGQKWAAPAGGAVAAEDVSFDPTSSIISTNVQDAIEEVYDDCIGGGPGGGGATVATTVAGLGGSPADGDIGLIRAGSSPYEFVQLIYDGTYAKWVSDVRLANTKTAASATTTSATYVSVSTGVQLRLPEEWAILDAAGLAPQFKLVALIGNTGAGTTTCGMLIISADIGANFNANGAEFGEITNTGATTAMRNSGWVDIPGGLTVEDTFTADIRLKASSGTASILSASIALRWVG